MKIILKSTAILKSNSKYRIIRYPSPILQKKCEEVTDTNTVISSLSRFKASCAINKGIAVAAPQLGIPLRFFYFIDDDSHHMAINPIIESVSVDTEKLFEGCLSIPGKSFLVERNCSLKWSYINQYGIKCNEIAYGMKARMIQHEVDHLDGICINSK